ncbi:MAG: methyltransferase domain-containing protein, partial [Planctomycetes bacterium]|nr:methyltransferase domain-containing protein [Planctomycetota bacterium]
VRAYALGAFHPKPKRVLMIGLASGSWAQVVAHHPDVEELIVVEINPGYIDAIRSHEQTRSLLDNPKVKIVIDDGRRWLRNNPDERFDAAVTNTTWHFRSHASALLSVEFLELIKSHLKEDGVYLYNTTSSERVQRTGMTVFEHGYRIINNIIVSKSPMKVDWEGLKEELIAYRIDGKPVLDLSIPEHKERFDEIKTLLATYASEEERGYALETRESILKRTEGMELITDDNMGTEWDLRNWTE